TEPGSDADAPEHPVDDLVERCPDGGELARDHLLQRQRPRVEARIELAKQVGVSEAPGDLVEQVDLRDRAVEVEDERRPVRALARHGFGPFACHTRRPDLDGRAAGEEAGTPTRARALFPPPPARAPRGRAARAARRSPART